jgi:hypothetical protein
MPDPRKDESQPKKLPEPLAEKPETDERRPEPDPEEVRPEDVEY